MLISARILSKVLETWGGFLSLRLQCKNISKRWCEKLARNNDNNMVRLERSQKTWKSEDESRSSKIQHWSVRILRKVVEICCHSNSSERPSANAGLKKNLKVAIMIMVYTFFFFLVGGLLFGEYFWSLILWWYVWLIVCSLQIYVGSLLKSKRSKTTRTKEYSKQSSTSKIKFIYQQIHEKGNITNILK